MEEPTKWYKHVSRVQRALNSTFQRSLASTPFQVLIGSPMRNKEDIQLPEIIQESLMKEFDNAREELREQAKQQIAKVKEENQRS